jgi:PKD repeat protein
MRKQALSQTILMLAFSLLGGKLTAQFQEFTSVFFPAPTDYITTTWVPDFGASQDFSLEFAMRSNGWNGTPTLVSSKSSVGSGAGFSVGMADNGSSLRVSVADGSQQIVISGGKVNDARWHHVLVSFDRGGQLSLYVDRQLVSQASIASLGNMNAAFPFSMGQDGGASNTAGATADLVNLRVWKRTMLPADLEAVACGIVDVSFPYILDLLHYWPMFEGQGSSVSDVIQGSTGTFVGNTKWSSGNIPSLLANFTHTAAATEVTFTNLCVDATYLQWSFGDGNTSTDPNPVHTYQNPGIYTVRLIAGNACERDTVTQNVTLAASGNTAAFNAARLCTQSRLDYIKTSFDPNFGANGDFTVEFRMRSNGWDGDPAIVSDKNWESGLNPGFVIALNNNSIKVNIGDGTNRADINGTRPLNDGKWHHVLASFDRNGLMQLYFDGQLEGEQPLSSVGNINAPFTLNIGQDGTANYPTFYSLNGCQAELAEVRIWNSVVNPNQTSLCDTLTASHPLWNQLLHYWHLNEGMGNAANDSKGNAPGNWQNNASWSLQNSYPPAGALFEENTLLSTVDFINQSTNGQYLWNFGDGTTTTEKNPSHTYLATGTYDVSLIVQGVCTADTLVKKLTINELSINLLTTADLNGLSHFAQFTDPVDFGTTQDFTLEMFVRTANWSGDPAIVADKNWSAGKNKGFVVAGKTDGKKWKFNIGDGVNRIDLDGGEINDNKWHHLAVSFSRSGAKTLYQDGKKIATTNTPFVGNIYSGLPLSVGQDGTAQYPYYFKGQIAEIRLWNAALDSATLAANTCAVTPDHPALATLRHYWKMDEGQGNLLNDAKGNNAGVYNGNWITTLNDLTDCQNQVPVNQTGAGNAADFDGFNDFITVPKNPTLLIEKEITVESWIKARSLQQWESFVCFAQDNGSNESGFDFSYVNNKLRFRLKTVTMGGNEWNNNPGANIPLQEWVHVAGTYDGNSVKMYVNGVLMEEQNKSGNINWTFQPLELRIGGYVDDNELYYWDGAVDELRIWKGARTTEEIRSMMCRRIGSGENDLIAYYRLDERTGNTVFDRSGGGLDGQMKNMIPAINRVNSGAGIGDDSAYAYGPNLEGQSVTLASAGKGSLTTQITQNNMQGMQIYRVDAQPLSTSGLIPVGNGNTYFGVVPAIFEPSPYHLNYHYGTFPAALGQASSLILGARKNGEGLIWTNTAAVSDTAAKLIRKEALNGRKEVLLGVHPAGACPPVLAVTQLDSSFNTVQINWENQGNTATVEWGTAGFGLGTGISAANAVPPLQISGLNAATTYDLYLQNSCGPDSLSSWVGPFTITTASCQKPGSLNATVNGTTTTFSWQNSNNGTQYTIEWGPAGFPLGLGVQIQNVNGNTYTLGGLPPNANLEFYVRSNCGSAGQSEWVGPFAFTTGTVSTTVPDGVFRWSLSPNPTRQTLQIELKDLSTPTATIRLIHPSGKVLRTEQIAASPGLSIGWDVKDLPPGVYLIEVAQGHDQERKLFLKL